MHHFTSNTPRTEAVYKANLDLGLHGITIIPSGHPPCDPWKLAENLETELNATIDKIEKLECEIKKLKDTLL